MREATTAGPRAIQRNFNGFMSPLIGDYMSGGRPDRQVMTHEEMSENCLNLNVLTPSLTGRRAATVYIHGGGFAIGSGVLTAISDRFVRENDVVLVGINHRLNMFGYLYLGGASEKYADSGNAGQLDLVLALRWVRDNISRFGGDPRTSPSSASRAGRQGERPPGDAEAQRVFPPSHRRERIGAARRRQRGGTGRRRVAAQDRPDRADGRSGGDDAARAAANGGPRRRSDHGWPIDSGPDVGSGRAGQSATYR